MALTEAQRKLWGAALGLTGVNRDPAEFDYLIESNLVQRALAHLLGFDGAVTRPLVCTTGGKLQVETELAAGTALLGVNVQDPATPAQKLGVNASGQAAVAVAAIGEYVLRRSLYGVLAVAPVWATAAAGSQDEFTHTGSGMEYFNVGISGSYAVLLSSEGAGVAKLYDSGDGVNPGVPLGIVTQYAPQIVFCLTTGYLAIDCTSGQVFHLQVRDVSM